VAFQVANEGLHDAANLGIGDTGAMDGRAEIHHPLEIRALTGMSPCCACCPHAIVAQWLGQFVSR